MHNSAAFKRKTQHHICYAILRGITMQYNVNTFHTEYVNKALDEPCGPLHNLPLYIAKKEEKKTLL